MAGSVPEEEVKRYIEEQLKDEIPELTEQVAREVEEQLAVQIEVVIQKVLSELEGRGFDTSRENIQMLAQESVLDALFGPEPVQQTAEVPIGGRVNEDASTEVPIESGPSPETYTEEVPIERGENPTTVEVERADSGTDPRLNTDLSAFDISRAFREGLTSEMLQEDARVNHDGTGQEDEEVDPEDVPRAGLPWYQ